MLFRSIAFTERLERSVERIEKKVDIALSAHRDAVRDIAVLNERVTNMKDAPARAASITGLIMSLLALAEIVFKLLPPSKP